MHRKAHKGPAAINAAARCTPATARAAQQTFFRVSAVQQATPSSLAAASPQTTDAAAAAATQAAPVLLLLLNQLPLLLSLQLLTGPQRGCRSSGWRAQQWA
jgi:hypothetical protein